MRKVILIAAVAVFSMLGLLTAEFAVADPPRRLQLVRLDQLTTLSVESR